MSYEHLTNEELRAELERLVEERGRIHARSREQDRLLHELTVHQVELEAQNRELREAQGALEESRHQYADLYDFAPVAYVTLSETGIVRKINLTGAAMIGRDRGQLAGVPFPALVALTDQAAFWAHLRRCLDARGPVETEMSFSTRAHGLRHFQVISVPELDTAGRSVALRTSFADITARRAAELELRAANEREQRRRRLSEGLDRASLMLSKALARLATPAELLQIVVDEARRMTGAELAAIGTGTDPDQPFSPWIHAGGDPEMAQAIGRPPRPVGVLGEVARKGATIHVRDLREHAAFAGFPPHHVEMTSFLGVPILFAGRSLGSLYLANKRPEQALDEEGQTARVTGVPPEEGFSTEDRRAVELLAERAGTALEIARLSEALYAAVRAREDLLAVVAHDLRNPLWGIRVNAEAMKLAGAHEADGRRIDAVLHAVTVMDGLIGDLLQAADIEARGVAIEPAPEDPAALVEEAFTTMGLAAEAKQLRLERAVAPDLPVIRCDRRRVAQVLSNLVGNAVKFTPRGGSIRIEAVRAGEQGVRFLVSDTGAGIPPEQLPRVFDRYWKGRPQDGSGVGLGLFIARGIVEAHGGELQVTSTVGVGTTFSFTIPAA